MGKKMKLILEEKGRNIDTEETSKLNTWGKEGKIRLEVTDLKDVCCKHTWQHWDLIHYMQPVWADIAACSVHIYFPRASNSMNIVIMTLILSYSVTCSCHSHAWLTNPWPAAGSNFCMLLKYYHSSGIITYLSVDL